MQPTAKKAIIVGASSGIGKSLAQTLAEDGYRVGLAARRLSLLLDSQQKIGNHTLVKQIDVSNISDATFRFSELVQNMVDYPTPGLILQKTIIKRNIFNSSSSVGNDAQNKLSP